MHHLPPYMLHQYLPHLSWALLQKVALSLDLQGLWFHLIVTLQTYH
jgi:hypothetical protein